MVLEKLSSALKESLRKIVRVGLVDKKVIEELVTSIKTALISSDVNIELANKICEKIKKRALSEKPPKSLTAREHTVNIVYNELTKFLGGQEGKVEIKEKPTKILLVGLFGSGKTTTAAKLAKLYKEQGYKVALLQTDTWRPAAYEQLSQLSDKLHIPFFGEAKEKNALKILKKYKSQLDKFNVVIADSAGRDALNKELIKEIKSLNKAFSPKEKLLVLSGDIGQAAQAQAQAFSDAVGLTGVIVTKLDGTAKGGGALSACATTGSQVKFIGVGERLKDFEPFKPKNFVSRLLGMGDLETLLKKAEKAISKESAEKLGKKLVEGKFTLTDLQQQMEAMKKMGPLSQLTSMIPGLSMMKLPTGMLQQQEEKMKSWKFLMDSMTPAERENPDIINASRIARIAKGSGRNEQEVRELLKQYKQMKKMMKMFGGGRKMQKLAKMFRKKGMPKIPGFSA